MGTTLCRPPFQEPHVTLKTIWIEGLTFQGSTLRLKLSVHNPNRYALKVKSLSYKVHKTSDGAEIANGELNESLVVPAKDSSVADASVTIYFEGIGAARQSIFRQGKVEFTVSGVLSIGHGKKSMKLPYSTRGSFEIFKNLPSVSAEAVGRKLFT